MLETAFRRCHNYIHGNEGMPKDAAFWQFLYLLFAKMHDERESLRTGRPPEFYVPPTEPFTEEGRQAIRQADRGPVRRGEEDSTRSSARRTSSPSPTGRWPSSSASSRPTT